MFAFRYEPDWLVDQFREHMCWVDGFAEYDTRGDDRPFVPPAEMVAQLKATARSMDADWVLFMAPDERLEHSAETTIRNVVARSQAPAYSFHLREMWTPTQYRVDGEWGRKVRRRLYRLDGPKSPAPLLDLNLYHLKMIDNRLVRHRTHTLYNKWDNRSRGFDYFLDQRGLRLESIEGREFYPPYTSYVVSM